METKPPHPGQVLEERYLGPLGVTHAALARHVRLSEKTILEIVHGRRGITPRTAWLLAQAFGTEPEYWMQLQAAWSLAKSEPKKKLPRLEKSVSQLPLLPLGPRSG
jgi:addiction module HigA family antidote